MRKKARHEGPDEDEHLQKTQQLVEVECDEVALDRD
jgi:hypothetical protein